jgi:hypothetical protein
MVVSISQCFHIYFLRRRLKAEGIRTLGELVDFCHRRGGNRWCPTPHRRRSGPAQSSVAATA